MRFFQLKSIRLKFEPRDLWLGVYWRNEHSDCHAGVCLRIYICVLPCLPLIFTFEWRKWRP